MTVTRQLPRPERRRTILHGAAVAFARAGFAATSMEDIAAEAGITKIVVYRHFDSKEELYRAVLERVTARLIEVFTGGLAERSEGFPGRTFLTVAREDPEAFRLLWRHAAREPEFAEYADTVRRRAADAGRALLAPFLPDPSLRAWAAATVVDYLVESVLNWLDDGPAGRDDEFVTLASASVRALIVAWGGTPPP